MSFAGAEWLLEGGAAGVLLAVALGLAAWAIYRRQLRHAAQWRRRVLPALRGLAVVAVALMIAQPVVSTSQTVRQTGRLTLVIDDSPSMDVADRQLPAGYKLAAARMLGLGDVPAEATALLEAAEALRETQAARPPGAGGRDAAGRAAAEELERSVGEALRAIERRGTADEPRAAALREELIWPLQRLVRSPDPATEPQIAPLRALAVEWAGRLEALYLEEVEHALARGEARIVEAVAAYDALSRSERIERLLSPGGDLRPRLEALGDLRVLRLSELAEGPLTGTDLAAALEHASQTGASPHAAVLLSDGRHNTGRPPLPAAERLGSQGGTLHTLLVAGTTPPPDLAVLSARGPSVVYRADQLHGRVTVIDAMPPGLPFSLRVQHEGSVLWEQSLTTSGEGSRVIEFSFPIADAIPTTPTTPNATTGPNGPPGDAGAGGELIAVAEGVNERLLVLEAVAVLESDEPQARTDNQTAQLPVRVTLGRGRVLVIDGRPRWDTRYLLSMLEREQRWEVRSVVGPPAEGERLATGPEALPATREELFGYDVVVLGEVPVDWLGMQWPTWLREFVDERGGGLVLLDGGRGVLAEYAATPLGEVMPVLHEEGAPAGGGLELTSAGEQEEALRLEGEGFANAQLWRDLPGPRQVAAVSAKPGMGRVLAEAVVGEERRPVMVRASFGRGRVWWQGLDETWRWRREAEGRWQTRLWSGVMSHVMEPPFAAEDERASIGVERAAVREGEAIAVRARVRDETGVPLTAEETAGLIATARLLRDGVEVATARLSTDAGAGGLLRGDLRAPGQPGLYEVALSLDRYSDAELTARAPLLVREPDLGEELGRLAGDADMMAQLAAAGGGGMLREWEAGRLGEQVGDLSRTEQLRRRYEVWASWPLFATAVGLLGLEWLLRRRAGMM